MRTKIISLYISAFLLCVRIVSAQEDDGMIRTTDGHAIITKSRFIQQCKKKYGAGAGDSVITKACECQANLLNNYFTTHQLGFYQRRYKENALQVIIEQDPQILKRLMECSNSASHLQLVSSPSIRKLRIRECVENLKKQSTKQINDTLATKFCNCAIDVMQKRKITMERVGEFADPSSFLFNEISYQCGSPFLKPLHYTLEWKITDSADITGLISSDSVQTISILGMTKIKINIGGITKIWMLDCGASDLLISENYANELKEKGVLTEMNYIGEGEYSLADNSIITCKRYKINGIKIGRFTLNNVVIASSKKAKEFLLGKSLLNKFSQWTLDNKNEMLILKK